MSETAHTALVTGDSAGIGLLLARREDRLRDPANPLAPLGVMARAEALRYPLGRLANPFRSFSRTAS